MTVPSTPNAGQEDNWQRPSPKLWLARRATLAVVATPLLIAAAVIGGISGGWTPATVSAAVVLVLAGTVYAVLARRYRSWAWAERDEDLLVRRGVLVRRLSIVPYGRMQFVDVTAGPIDRIFGLSTVQLHTAAARTDARIPGLAAADATRLRDQLSSLGEAQAAGL